MLFNVLFDQHGIDAMFMPLQVTAKPAPAIADAGGCGTFAGFCVTDDQKAAVAELRDASLLDAEGL